MPTVVEVIFRRLPDFTAARAGVPNCVDGTSRKLHILQTAARLILPFHKAVGSNPHAYVASQLLPSASVSLFLLIHKYLSSPCFFQIHRKQICRHAQTQQSIHTDRLISVSEFRVLRREPTITPLVPVSTYELIGQILPFSRDLLLPALERSPPLLFGNFLPFVVSPAEVSVQSEQTERDAVPGHHDRVGSRIARRFGGAKRLRADKVTGGVA